MLYEKEYDSVYLFFRRLSDLHDRLQLQQMPNSSSLDRWSYSLRQIQMEYLSIKTDI